MMDLANVWHQTQSNTETRAICGTMIQKWEGLKCIEHKMAQLAENKRGIEEDLVHLCITDAIGIALIGETPQRMYSSCCAICNMCSVLPTPSDDLCTLGILLEPLGNCALGLGM